ncbi:MAG: Non-ribosomal peptide synthetase module [Benniella sp.]|nr:MAG: Non-ribosomal peptide synthetase module [Benniella sp.]
MTQHNGQLAGMIPAENPTTARRAMDERPTAECEMSLDDANSPVISHALTTSSAVALSSNGGKERPFAGIGNITHPSSAASSDPGQPNLPLSQTQYDYWKKALADAPAILGLPTDRSRASPRSTDVSTIPIQLDASLTRSLKQVATEYDMDLGMVVLTGWGAVLARLSNQDDIVIGLQHGGPGGLGGSKQLDDTCILPLRMDLSGEPTISQLLERVRKMASSSMDHQGIPLNVIADITSTPLFHVAFQWNSQALSQSFSTPIHVDMKLELREQNDEVTGNMVFSSDLFNPDTIKRHAGYLLATLKTIAKNPTQPVATIDIFSPEERRLILETWNETSEVYPDHLCFHQLFELQVDKTPDATAIVYEDQSLTYSEFNARANCLAHHLIGLGVQPDTRVAICVERSPAMIIGVLAIMKAGGAYVPLDPSYASVRLNDILQDASPAIVVADQTGQAVLEDSTLTVVDPNMPLDNPISNPYVPELTSRHLAYIIYTSGSTGKPKGVMIEHRGVVNLAQTHTKFCGIHQQSRVLQFAPLSFDASVWDTMLPLSCGASLYLPRNPVRQDRDTLWKYMIDHSITHASFTPSFLQDGRDLPLPNTPITLVLGGEPLGLTLVRNLITQGYTVINDFGPTEVTVSATTWRCPPEFEGSTVPIGRPVIHSRIYLLDRHGQPVPLGAIGEMYVGGIGVARGYLNRSELTAERFLLDPFAGGVDARMYRTGDLARYLPDGNIVFLGRNDDQVKIRGFRIELGEIESHLSEHPLVQKAAVLASGEGAAKRLVAYVVAKPKDQLVHKLRAHLVSRLPDYMIPAAIIRLDNLPLTSNDKIDRNALPEPDSSAFAQQAYEEPQGEIETCLAQLWAELLSLDKVGRHDDFFTLGGHSLLATRMLNRLRQHNLATSISTVYQSPVLSVLAQVLEKHQADSIPPNLITPQTTKLTPEMLPLISLSQSEIDHIIEMTPGGVANIQDIYSLSPFQDGVLFHHLLTTEGDPYLICAQMAFETRDLLDRYLQAFQEVVNRHDILRTAFIWKDISTHVQVVWRIASLPIQELTLDPADGPIAKQLDERFHPKHYRIDLTQAPLLRFTLAQDTDGRWILFQLIHHLIGDHVAAEIMNSEIEQILHGHVHSLPTPHPFRNAIAQARSKIQHDIHEPFFQDMLGDIDEPTFPYGMVEVQNNGADIAESHSILSQELNTRLRLQAKLIGVSLASLCHVAWSLVLARTSGQERVVFGTVLFGGAQNDQEVGPTMGIFINTLPFRCDINSQSVRECVHLAHIRLAALLEHEHASLALAQKWSGVPAGTPLFSALLNYVHTSLPRENSEKLDMEFTSEEEQVHYPGIEFLGGRERTNYPFGINVLDYGTDLGLAVQTQQPVDSSRVEGYMKQALECLVDALESDPDVAVARLEILPSEERELLTHGFNTTRQSYPADLCIHHLFEQHVNRTPEATALVFNGQSLTYTALNERANKLAHHLISLGVRPDSLVAICVERSFAMIVGALAILKAGGAYIPLDVAYASERLRDILMDSNPYILIADHHGKQALGESILSSLTVLDPNVIEADSVSFEAGNSLTNPQVQGLTPRNLVYIIFTSGSTGKPKGVMVEHQGLSNLVMTRRDVYGISDSSRVLQFFSFAFDGCAMDIFSTLCSGASLHILTDALRYNQKHLWDYLDQNSITQALLPPAIFQSVRDLPRLCTSLTLILGGEALPAALIQALQPLIPNGRIVNDYGPTEATVSSIAWRCPEGFVGDIVPIGRPIANKRIYILDEHQQPSPLGAIGELYIGGVGVARGYLNRPELTSQVFLPDPFAGDTDARMYKTGDLARYLPDGNIIFLGRNDHQVKIRGFRIELGEIEARLSDHPRVDKAAVITIGEGSEKRLVAYVVSKADGKLLSILRAHLTSCLPEYMIPAAMVRLDSLPINSNGKLDRKALPVPNSDAFSRETYEEPQGDVETSIAHIWAEVLNLDRVSRNDNFFALGGHSLLAVRLMNRVASIGVQLPLSTIFASPTLSSFADSVSQYMDKEATTYSTIHPISRDGDLPLSFSQQRMWFLAQMEGVSETYHISMAVRLYGDLNRDAWQRALDALYARHESLRSVFVAIDGQPQVRLLPAQSGMPIRWKDLRGTSDTESQLERMSTKEDNDSFDLAQGPLIRILMVQLDSKEYAFMVTQHHIVSDGWSSAIFNRELSTLYSAYCNGEPDPLAPLSIQYPDYAAWQKQWLSGDRLETHTTYWKTALTDAPVLLDLPTDRPRPPQQSYAGDNIPIHWDSDLTRSLNQLCQEQGVTLYMIILAAWSCVLSRLSGQDDIVIGSPSANRNHHQIESLIGLFVNTLALRIDLSGDPTMRQLLARVKKTSLDAQNHQDLPFEQVVNLVHPPRSLSHTPLFQVMFVLQNNEVSECQLPGLEAVGIDSSYDIAKFDITLELYESETEFTGSLSYSTALFDRETMERHVGYLCTLLQAMAVDVDRPITSVNLLSQLERNLVLGESNGKQQDYPTDLCIHHLFEQQVQHAPQTTALVLSGQSLTYSELNERANRLAHHLIGLGVQPDNLVAICVERSFAMIIGVLGILKAGGAYVPLDPAYASDRLRDILADAAPSIVIADESGRRALGERVLSSLTVVNPDSVVALDKSKSDFSHNPQVQDLTASNLAYVIFTSGSTGKPKGVMIEHRGVVNLAQTHTEFCGIYGDSRVLSWASLSFDASVWDMMLPLSCGASLYLPADSIRQDRDKVWEYMAKHSITHASFTPSFLQDGKNLPTRISPLTLVLGGEPLGPALLQKLIAQGYTVINDFGPTELTVSASTWRCPSDFKGDIIPIGRPVIHSRIYLLDKRGQPVPLGAIGEMYVGGIGVARGYLNQPELTAKAFLADPFAEDRDARMYKTGDLARYLPDGNLVYLGRNDHQVKIRGFRIELGEIDARLVDHPLVDEATVVAIGEGSDKKLVGYVVAKPDDNLLSTLRAYLTSCLPGYMVPAAIVRLDSLPINSNGKLDRSALPAPDSGSFARQVYEEPHSGTETTVARIWADLLHVDRVGRSDNFFALGGHSLLAVQMIERLRCAGLTLAVSALFKTPTLSTLVQSLDVHKKDCDAPTNLIMPATTNITPEMLPLITLLQEDIDHIVKCVPGGVTNVQDIYSLSPLQEGILFHHLLATEGDPYLDITLMAFENREMLDKYLGAIQMVVNRHDILRTAVLNENLSTPAQVVWRQAPLSITELQLDPSNGPIPDQLRQRLDPRQYRIDITQAPLMKFTVARDTDGRWILANLHHHLIGDHTTLEVMFNETMAFMNDQGYTLPAPQPFRNLVAQAKLSHSQEDHERFFKEMLQDIDTPSLPFGLKDVHGQGDNVTLSYRSLPQDLNDRLRKQAKYLGVSVASLCHLAWAQVISHTSGEDRVVFGTVLFGRMNSGQGSDSAMGLFINTLPLRVDLTGTVRESVLQTHERLASLLDHEHASLVLAQRCSNVPQGTPLFSAMLNYRHNVAPSDTTSIAPGIEYLESQERNNYPFAMAVEDYGVSLGLTAKVVQPLSPTRVCGYMEQALESLVSALDRTPDMIVHELSILPEDEQELLLREWNAAQQCYPADLCIHNLFEQQVERTPYATALVFNDQSMTYVELNERANRLAQHLIGLGVQPEGLVAICVERSIAMILGVLAILKAGGAYVPLDPAYTSNRLRDILVDASPSIVIADVPGKLVLGDAVSSMTVVDPNEQQDIDQRVERTCVEAQPVYNPLVPGLTSSNLAYIIYTSGSTGKPKGVMIEHRGVVNLIHGRPESFGISTSSRALLFTSLSFDHSVSEIFSALTGGACLHLVQDEIRLDRLRLWEYFEQHSISHTSITPTLLQDSKDLPPLTTPLTFVIMGETLSSTLIPQVQKVVPNGKIINEYGPTETTVATTIWKCPHNFNGDIVPIGRPIPNKTMYILDKNQQPVPMGAIGELYIGGVGVARGYLNRPELTAKVFLPDPFSEDEDARMYKTGDQARYLPDGNIIFLGRNDHQVKIRGFRIELGEIEARLVDHPLVDKAVVITVGEGSDKRLVGYVVAKPDDNLVNALRSHLTSCLPEYMVPAAIVRLDSLPINSNGKLDRKALPDPDSGSFARQVYEEPQGRTETTVARIWADLLHVDRVGRSDNFFALGGHSLLAVQMIERLRRAGFTLAVSALFKTPTLSALVQSLDVHKDCDAPTNLIMPGTTNITPEMLPLITLSQWDIDRIVERVPGGAANIQDIYSLSPLQEGILFHHLLATEGDPYLHIALTAFETRELLDKYLGSVQMVVNRHDILRTAVLYENLSTPAQVVWRQAPLSITELQLDPSNGPIPDQLKQRLDPRQYRIDITQAPLMRFTVAQDTDGRWILAGLDHHLISDNTTLEVMFNEIKAFMNDQGHTLPAPQPFRNLIAQAKLRHNQEDHERFFKEMLIDIDTPSLPFGLKDVHGQGNNVTKSYQQLPQELNDRLRRQAKKLGVSVASLCHLAWAQVISCTSGENRVVFGTVLFGRMNSGQGSDSAMGLFINTLPIRVDLTGTVRESVLKAHERLASLLDHEHASLALAQRCSSVPQGTPLFSAILNYRHSATAFDMTSIAAGIKDLEYQEDSNYPITLSVEDSGVSLGLTVDVVQPFSPTRVCGYMQQALEGLSSALEHEPETIAHELNILPEEERGLLLQTWNVTQQDVPSHQCMHHVFEQQVERTPQAIALVFGGQSLTYSELNERANRLAHHLIGLGVQPDNLVAICVERSFAMIIGVLGILKAGGAYVPLDPAYASDRLRDILADAAPSIVIADESGRRALGERVLSSLTVVNPDSVVALDKPKSDFSHNPQVQDLTASNLAYVIFTSGSTGKPKGVMIEHRGVVNLAQTHTEFCGIYGDSRVLSWASLSFDASVWDMMLPLSCGASLYLPADSIRQDRDKVWEYMAKHSITHASFTPSFLQDGKNLPTRISPLTLVLGGEPLGPALLQKLIAQGYTVINDFGPTELTVSASTWRCPSDFKGDIIPIGRPVIHSRIYLLDKRGQPVPLGAIGEMYVGGIGVARGYLNQPELTAKAFLADPFAEDRDARMYKTGDLARYLPDGNLVYLGRNDHQVKIRGFRIELGEIDARLVDHPLVDEATVVAIGEGSDKKLVGYVVAKPDDNLLSTLRAYLTSCLPGYMVPAAIVRLDSLPLNSNGKLDLKALPVPDRDAYARQVYEEPQGEIETAIAQIWAEVLNIDHVSRNDNFFSLGGHSLLAVRLMNRVASLGVQIPLSTVFSSPTLLSFAESISQHMNKETTSYSTIDTISREGDLPLSFSQQRMWFLAQMDGVSVTYHIPSAVRLRGELDLDAWQRALDTLFARHEALRSVFVAVDGQPQVRLLPAHSGLPIRWKDLQGVSDAESEVEKMSANEATIPFDLAQGPLIRVLMVQLDTNEHMFMVTQHHIVSDGWSSAIFNRELSTLYSGYCNGEPDPLLPLSIQYPDYAAWQKQWLSGDRLETHTTYWKTVLTDAPVLLDLPTDRPRPPQQSYAGDNIPIHWDSDLTRSLSQLCQEQGVTLYMAILAAWSCVLSRLSGQDDIIIGSPSANRNHHEIEPLIGFFVNTLALRIDLSGGPTARQLLERVKKTSLDAQNHQDLPFEQVVDVVQPPRNLSHSPLFQVMLVLQNQEISEQYIPGLEVVEIDPSYDIAKFDLTLELYESEDEIVGGLVYSTALFDHASMERHAGYLCTLLQAMVMDVDQDITSIDLLSHSERDLVLEKWNETRQDYPDHLCIHHLFEQQVERAPQATAVVVEGQSLTYAELNERANILAHHLIGLGVQPESPVAICVERSFAMIVGVLAILKAGGAFVPLDPAYSSERLRDILMDASPGILVSDEYGKQALGYEILSTLTVVDPNRMEPYPGSGSMVLGGLFPNPQVQGLTSRNLAYIIFTSGSTGKPKGVMVEHQGLVNLIMTRHDVYGIRASSRVSQFFSFAFDGCTLDVFMALGCGGSLYILTDNIRMDLPRLWDYLERESITQAILTPSVLQNCINLPPLRTPLTLILAGEVASATLIKAMHQLIPNGRVVNDYGPTEATVSAIAWKCPRYYDGDIVPIGRPIANKKAYLLDEHRRPVPIGTIGELYIGGVGVARGYLNRPELTSKAFLPDPFAGDEDARMYKTGDLARYLPDGNFVYLGRNDDQVKIRGFRIELGEIEARLNDHPQVDKAAVITVGEGSKKRLVGYVVAKPDDNLLNALRTHLTSCLPEYMIPAAIVRLDSFPINTNGKLDRKALPIPDNDAFARQMYEAPQGSTETAVARIWEDLLHLDRVSRNDNFFALGGHSLLVVQMIERLRRIGLSLAVSALFKTPTLSALVQSLDIHKACEAPTNLITSHTTNIVPEMLPLIDLSQTDIDHIINLVPGGVSNIQDIYALSPLQEGILFHHLLATEGDPYLLISFMSFETRELLDKYLEAIQKVVDRHDILRTAVLHEHLSVPAQVVWRHASLSVNELELDPLDGPILDQLKKKLDPRKHRIDITQAPLLRFTIARDTDGQWILAQLLHHLIGDHTTLDTLSIEIEAYMDGQGHTLASPQPFRNLIAQARSSQRQDDHERFFKEMLQDIDTPSLPFGLKDVHGQGDNVTLSYRSLPQDLNDRLRKQAKYLGVSVASLCHLAWAQVISHTSGEDRVVFGTVLFGRMNSGQGSDSAMGLFINTLPLRVDLTGTIRESVLQTHERLASLLDHEHASLALAQSCSSIPRGTPLFSAMLNYRHSATLSDTPMTEGIEYLESHERNNYPFAMAVEDYGVSLGLTAKVVQPLSPTRVCRYMEQALESLVSALDRTPDMIVHELSILPEDEQELLLREWNATQQCYPADLCIHNLFEQQVERTPHGAALVFNDQSLTYAELNERANRLAHHLIGLGVQPEGLVAICIERSIAMIVGVLAVLKAGGAYVPLDPAYTSNRLRDIIVDASPSIVIADVPGKLVLGDAVSSMTVVDPNEQQDTDQRAERTCVEAQPVCNPLVPGLTSSNLAYIIYTSGSTGKPKGVMIEHRGVVNLIHGRPESFGISTSSRALLFTSLSFDHSVSEIFSALTGGACLHLVQDEIRLDRLRLWEYFEKHSISHTSITPTLLQDSKDLPPLTTPLTFVIMGETLPSTLIPQVQKVVPNGKIINEYGPTETTVATTIWKCPHNFNGDIVPIGRPIPNKTMYILDKNQQPVPMGAIGELYIGGVGVARGYLNRPELTAKVFLPDPFAGDKCARMYKTGDLAQYLPDGNILFLGRNDHQVKIRGFRIELGEIETRLSDHPLVQSAAVVAMGDGSDKRLVAYVVAEHDNRLVHILRSHIKSCLPDYMVPAAFVRLDDLPLSANGKLDRHRLPEPDSDALAYQQYEPPHGEMETALMTIWINILNIDKIGRHDNFFMLGGHSLLAVRMISQVQSLMGYKITLGTLFMAPTIAELVPHMLTSGNTQEDAFDVLLPIRPRGSRHPLFCVHHGVGLSWSYIGLSRHLHPDQPIYGLQARGFFEGGQSATTLEDMVLDYMEQIRRIQPHGPYCLLGYSFGGVVVHTMAAHLESQGERVALLAVMDTVPRNPTIKSSAATEKQNSEAHEEIDVIHFFTNRVESSLPDRARSYLERLPQVVQQLTELAASHTSPRCKAGMVLFRAMIQKDPSWQPISPDVWRPHVMGEIDVFDIDCEHYYMDQPAPLAEIGSVLAQRLNEVHATEAKEF